MSGEALALAVGYKSQSAIGNLENRKDASGGRKIARIAEALNVPIDWLLNGPDSAVVPFLGDEPIKKSAPASTSGHATAAWPFASISPEQYASLGAFERGQIEGFAMVMLTRMQQRWAA